MTAIDPFNHGSTETLNSHVVLEEQQRAVLRIMRRFRGGEYMWITLDALGLSPIAEAMLLSRRVTLGLVPPPPDQPKLSVVPPTAKPAPKAAPPKEPLPPLEYGERMCGAREHPLPAGGECLQCKNRRSQAGRRRATIQRARAIVDAIPTAEVSPVDSSGAPVRRCAKRLHHRPDSDTAPQCAKCRQIMKAKLILAEERS